MESINDAPIALPAHISMPNHQLGGHVFGTGKTKFGVLKDSRTSRLLKPIIDVRGKRECEFYQSVWSSEDNQLQSFVPKFYGLVTIEKVSFIQIEDVIEGLTNPSNMDIKIGIITYDPGADCDKIKDEMSKSPWQEVMGFRICGIRVYDQTKSDKYTFMDRRVTRQLRPDEIPDTLDFFFGSNDNSLINRQALCENYLFQMQSISEWFDKVNINHLKFLSSSLLFVHSSDSQNVLVKMIDFAHVFPNTPTKVDEECKDDNYLFGLNKLIQYFQLVHGKLQEQSTIKSKIPVS